MWDISLIYPTFYPDVFYIPEFGMTRMSNEGFYRFYVIMTKTITFFWKCIKYKKNKIIICFNPHRWHQILKNEMKINEIDILKIKCFTLTCDWPHQIPTHHVPNKAMLKIWNTITTVSVTINLFPLVSCYFKVFCKKIMSI